LGARRSSNGLMVGPALAAPNPRATVTIAVVSYGSLVHGAGAHADVRVASTRLVPWVNIGRSFSAS